MVSKHVTTTSSGYVLATFDDGRPVCCRLGRFCQLLAWARQDEAVIGVARRQMDDVPCRWPVLKTARSPRVPADCPGRRPPLLGLNGDD